jgi:hypothetical protein
MKTISDQLKDLGLKHGDLCEIEGVEGRCLVLHDPTSASILLAKTSDGGSWFSSQKQVTCGWKAKAPTFGFNNTAMGIHYERVLPAPIPKPLPEAVEDAIEATGWTAAERIRMSEVARAILAECKKV